MVVDAFEQPSPEPAASAPGTCAEGSAEMESGSCGCSVPDEDVDGDGIPDCLDECPDNAGASVPAGPCGCSSYTDLDACSELRGAIRNLYTFDAEGTRVVDSRGGADGVLLDLDDTSALDGLQRSGRLRLDGQGSYVDLPDGLISSLDDATFEAWVTWRGGDPWARIFDFGDNGGTPVDGVTYLFLTPSSATGRAVRVAYSLAGPLAETVVEGDAALPIHAAPDDNTPDHVAVVIDRSNASMHLYSNGVEVASRTQSPDLGALNDVNNWLGRSNYLVDPPLSALLIEFRIYARALTAAQILSSYQAGPGALD
jgi:hypothetical protein